MSTDEPWLGRSSVVVSSRKAERKLVVCVRVMRWGGAERAGSGAVSSEFVVAGEDGKLVVGLGPLVGKLKTWVGKMSYVAW